MSTSLFGKHPCLLTIELQRLSVEATQLCNQLAASLHEPCSRLAGSVGKFVLNSLQANVGRRLVLTFQMRMSGKRPGDGGAACDGPGAFSSRTRVRPFVFTPAPTLEWRELQCVTALFAIALGAVLVRSPATVPAGLLLLGVGGRKMLVIHANGYYATVAPRVSEAIEQSGQL